jgi:uncharacterized protein (DUF736 family)
MATIGTFTKKDATYQGTITTLTLKAKVNITPVARENDKAPVSTAAGFQASKAE